MLKKSLSFVVLGGLMASSAFAFQPFEFLHKKPKVMPAAKLKKPMLAQEYTDFSGDWTGSCTGDEYQVTVDMTIKNDGYTISFNNQAYLIGNLNTESLGDSLYTSYDHFSFHWNGDKSALIGDFVDVFKFHAGNNASMDEHSISASIGNVKLSMKDDKLNIESRAKNYYGSNETEEVVSCTLTRVQH